MRIPKSVLIKDTVSLFANKYIYKVSLVCPVAYWFRGGNVDHAKSKIAELYNGQKSPPWLKIKDVNDINYCKELCDTLEQMVDFIVRVEQPILSVYTSNPKDVELLVNVDENRVKYICIPNKVSPIPTSNSVIVKKLNYDFKVFVGKTTTNYSNFLAWAENNTNIRLTKRIKKDLSRPMSWGGGYFYVRGEKNLTAVKLFIGSNISKIEQVIKA